MGYRVSQTSEWRSKSTPVGSAGDPPPASDAILPGDIHNQLKRILDSEHFRGTLRLTCFLKFVVETTLAGKPESIKAYTIAIEALGRGEDFDPQRDPIVRVEAGRLRQALARYYAEAGRDDPIMIELPRGTYVPVFRRGNTTMAPPASSSGDATTDAATLGVLARRPELLETRRQSDMLHAEVSRQSKELAAQISTARGFLAESRALLSRPLPDTASHPSPPLTPAMQQAVNAVADKPMPAETTGHAEHAPASEPPRFVVSFGRSGMAAFLAGAKYHIWKGGRIFGSAPFGWWRRRKSRAKSSVG